MASQQPIGLFKNWRESRPVLLRHYAKRIPSNGMQGFFYPHHLTAWRVLSGEVEVEIDGQTWRAGEGEWLILPARERIHRIADDVQLWSTHFYFETNGFVSGLNLNRVFYLQAPAPRELEEKAKRLQEAVSQRLSSHAHVPGASCAMTDYLAVQSVFLEWLRVLLEILEAEENLQIHAVEYDPRIDEVIRRLDRMELHERPDVEEIARGANLTVRHLNRLFAEHVHISPVRYFERRRLMHAQNQLVGSSQSIKVIASELGFTRLSKFSNWFARLEGCSPSEFRRQLW
jgi:AraC-like DNA-binding protein